MMRGIAFGVLCSSCGLAFAGNSVDGQQFMLDFRTSQSGITATSVGNALNASGASPSRATLHGGASAETKVHQRLVECVTPMYPWQTNDVHALHLPQHTRYEEIDGVQKKRINPVAISFPGSAIKSERQTTYVRFRWSGPADPDNKVVAWLIQNGYDYNTEGDAGIKGVGWSFGIKGNTNDTQPGAGHLVFMVSRATQICNWDSAIYVDQDVWYDMFIDIEPSPSDAAKSKVLLSILKPPMPRIVDGEEQYSIPMLNTLSLATQFPKVSYSDSHSSLRLGAESASTSYESVTQNWNGFLKGFKGDIARLMTWNRLLSEDEKVQVMSGGWGSTFRLGFENGLADEFSADSSENIWTPTNSWASARRSLTFENPSLTIRDVVPEREIGVAKVLHIKPVAAKGSLPVEVSVNGESIGMYDLSFPTSRAICIPGEKWMNSEHGYVEIKIERKAPFETSLEVDAITLGGGWHMNGGMTREGYIRSHHFIGTGDPRTVSRATTIQPSGSYPCVSFSAWIADDALAMVRYSFAVKIKGGNANDIPHSFWVNGRKFAEFETSAANKVLSAQVPPDFLKAGENVFSVSNCWPDASLTRWIRYSDYSIEVKRVYGLSVVVR